MHNLLVKDIFIRKIVGKIHILLWIWYKLTEHAVYFPHGTISFKTGENVVRMSPGKGAILSVVVLPSCRTDLLEVQRRIYVAKYNI